MLSIARELKNSETAFMFEADSPDYDIEVTFLFYTHNRSSTGAAMPTNSRPMRPGQRDAYGRRNGRAKTKAGILPVDVVRAPNDYSITMTQGTPAISAPFGDAVRERIADALGIAHEEICHGVNIPLRLLPPAIPGSAVPLCSNELLHGLRPTR
ncbi:MAG: hypothetical protein ACLTW9_00520 [Enterocloster sp.]